MIDKTKIINAFYGGQIRDDMSSIPGNLSNAEEVDIFSNKDFIQAEQIVSAETLPASSEIYAYDAGPDDVTYAYGKETAAGKVRLFSVANGGSDNPGNFGTLFTSADGTNLATTVSDLKFHKTSETGNNFLYYISGASTTWNLVRYRIDTAAESTVGQLTGLTGSFMRPTMKRFYGELFICNGQYIAKVDGAGVFTEKAFTLPNNWVAVDIIPVSDVALILARPQNRFINETQGYWWDLNALTQFDDQFHIPMGGAQWMHSWKEKVIIFCAINGIGKFWQLSGAYPGAMPIELPNKILNNVAAETTLQPVSSSKMISEKDGTLYFGVYKTDKSGIYAIGQLDYNMPIGLLLSKRFNTTDYSKHYPTALFTQGPNFYASYSDNGTATSMRCESNNSPTRSSQALIETTWIDEGKPMQDKDLFRAYLKSYPLTASTSLDLYVASDMSSSYVQIKRADDTIFNTANGILGIMRPTAFLNKKAYKAKVLFTSSTTNSPKLQAIGLRYLIKDIK